MDPGATAIQCECTPCKPDPDEKKPGGDEDPKTKCPGGKCPPDGDKEDPKTKCPGGKCPPGDGDGDGDGDGSKKKCPGGICPPGDGGDSKKCPGGICPPDGGKEDPKTKCPGGKCPPGDGDGDGSKKKCPGGICPPGDGGDDTKGKKKCPGCPDGDGGDDPNKKCPGGKCPPDEKKCPGGKCPPGDDGCTGDDCPPKEKCPPGCVCPTKCPTAETVTVTATKTVTVNVPGVTGGPDADDCQNTKSAWPLRRMWNAAWQDHFYDTDGNMINYAGTIGFVEEYPPGRVFLSQVADTVPLWRCFWPLDLDHLYTADEAEFRAAVAKGCEAFPEPGSIGFLYKTQKCKSLPLYRLYSEQRKDHLYTSDSAERDNLIKTGVYKDEGITGYVLPNWGPGGPGT
ncbi:hypothetical protein P691DRAFT_737730 [Macrolepiota fuliginosa MF-IS2]|uniref:DUF5648 domain-containing protein n=1 Tax=Macrolepiota fuliginosa MF-IS2 TaxID=1400762 RepID=A0A9P6BX17_9AGAR|nr:hypothetical protein P691DRAFT_737730 [Macrolepiota fuliginosa MF-IS2]